MNEKFVDGLFVDKPSEKAPEFVKARLGINTSKFIEYLQNHTKASGYCNIDILESKDKTKYYAALNDYEKKDTPTNNGSWKKEDTFDETEEDLKIEDIPF